MAFYPLHSTFKYIISSELQQLRLSIYDPQVVDEETGIERCHDLQTGVLSWKPGGRARMVCVSNRWTEALVIWTTTFSFEGSGDVALMPM